MFWTVFDGFSTKPRKKQFPKPRFGHVRFGEKSGAFCPHIQFSFCNRIPQKSGVCVCHFAVLQLSSVFHYILASYTHFTCRNDKKMSKDEKLKMMIAAQRAKLAELQTASASGGEKKKRPATCQHCHQSKSTCFRAINPKTGKDTHACLPKHKCADFSKCQYVKGHPEVKAQARLEKLEQKQLDIEAENERKVLVL